LPALTEQTALGLFDTALHTSRPVVITTQIDTTTLRETTTPPLLHALAPPKPTLTPEPAHPSLDALSQEDRARVVLDIVRSHVARALGHGSGADIEPDRAFRELGFDSLAATELRNQLNTATGLRLPATLVFDCPTSEAVADHILAELAPAESQVDVQEEEQVRVALQAIPLHRLREAGLLESLLELAGVGAADEIAGDGSIDALDADELIGMVMGGDDFDGGSGV
ncbi:acyl carrier protein, partial [Amycolatopsis minnesotensis]|uniref:acyl carrier protein n=1 Tax=Amycolatopsis minnesotensis TaxID=337894 RepID=UPI0031E0CA46